MHHDDSLNHLYHIWWFYSDGEFCSTERFSCAWKPTTKALSRVKAAMHSSVMPWPEVQSQSSYPNWLFLSYYLFLPKRYIPQHQIRLSHLNQLGVSLLGRGCHPSTEKAFTSKAPRSLRAFTRRSIASRAPLQKHPGRWQLVFQVFVQHIPPWKKGKGYVSSGVIFQTFRPASDSRPSNHLKSLKGLGITGPRLRKAKVAATFASDAKIFNLSEPCI